MEETIKNDFELSPSEYFEQVKERKNHITDEDLRKVYDNCLELLNKYKITGQKKGMKKLMFHLECIEKKREENGQINIPLIYEYKGSSNCYLHLLFNDNDGTIQIFNDYNEFMKVVTEGRGLADFIKELADGKYA